MGALWFLLLVGLLTALPCAGQAQAVSADRSAPAAAVPESTVVGPAVAASPTTGAPQAPATPRASGAEHASRQAGAPRTGPAVTPSDRLHAEEKRHWTWCSADGEPPHRDNGCSGHPYCAQDAQLPNPPPHPQPAVTARPQTPEAQPRLVSSGLLDGPRPAPDLHELQVHRS
ncbi:hypothetical protein [Kitasatospora sp. NPDC058218]|uniref:hypothetical protein n=1 Tax=Kitasatospora sp. NPDC058218 TaxID=3346385 RepID=UPI0036DB684A